MTDDAPRPRGFDSLVEAVAAIIETERAKRSCDRPWASSRLAPAGRRYR
jgi:hypothetical protein